jgi:DNA-binding GntR family transcriptional regulator
VRVIDLSEREIVELFEVRFALLSFAAELAAGKAGANSAVRAAALKRTLEQPRAAGDRADVVLHGDFSRWVFEAAGNRRLAEAYERPLLQSLLYVGVARKHGGDRDELRPYAHAVIDAIVSGQAAKARRAVRALTLQTLRHVRDAAHIGR